MDAEMRQILKEEKISIKAGAKMLNVPYGTFSSWIWGNNRMPPEARAQLLQYISSMRSTARPIGCGIDKRTQVF